MPQPRLMLVGEITIKPDADVHWSEIEISPAMLHAMVVSENGVLTYWIPELPPLPIEITFQAAGGKETRVLIADAKPARSTAKGKAVKQPKKGGDNAIRRDVTLSTGD